MAKAIGAGALRSWYFIRCAQLWRAAIQKPIFLGPFTMARDNRLVADTVCRDRV